MGAAVARSAMRRCINGSLDHTMQTVTRIRPNRNRSLFQLSLVPECSDFFASQRWQGMSFKVSLPIFPSDVLDLSVRFGENGLLPKDIMRAIQQERTS
jgi:hypothetical protein